MQLWRVGDVRRAARRGLERPGDTGQPRGRTVDPGVEALRSTGDSTRRRGQRRRSQASVLSILSLRSRGFAAATQAQPTGWLWRRWSHAPTPAPLSLVACC